MLETKNLNGYKKQQPTIIAVSKSTFTCVKNWITPDGRTAFVAGKEYSKAKTSQLALVGENYIVIFISNRRLSEYFC
jgi:hypothetical protein